MRGLLHKKAAGNRRLLPVASVAQNYMMKKGFSLLRWIGYLDWLVIWRRKPPGKADGLAPRPVDGNPNPF